MSVYQNLSKRILQTCAVHQLHLDKAVLKEFFKKQFVCILVWFPPGPVCVCKAGWHGFRCLLWLPECESVWCTANPDTRKHTTAGRMFTGKDKLTSTHSWNISIHVLMTSALLEKKLFSFSTLFQFYCVHVSSPQIILGLGKVTVYFKSKL